MDSAIMAYKGSEFLMSAFKNSKNKYNNMDTDKDVISKLKFIGCINKGEKINVCSTYPYIQQNDLATSLSRTFYCRDNRGNALNFLHRTIERSFKMAASYSLSKKKSDHISCRNIVQDLVKAKRGMNNLKQTYPTDTMFCCEINTLIQDIDTKLSDYENWLEKKKKEKEENKEKEEESKEENKEEENEENDY